MSEWLWYPLGVLALVVLAPGLAWLGRRYGRSLRGNVALAGILLGLGEAIDPPPVHRVESAKRRGETPPGDPPTTG